MSKSNTRVWVASAGVVVLLVSPRASAGVLFSDPAESLVNFTLVADADTSAAPFDYSQIGIPEAPGTVAGSLLPTTGFQLQANKGDANAAVTGLNLVVGATPLNFDVTHTLEFYVWMNIPANVSATSEDFVAGVARSNLSNAIYGNFRTSRGNGGWMLQGNDNGLSVDHRELNNGILVNSWDAAAPEAAPKFNQAFQNNLNGPVAEAGNEWVKVDIVFDKENATTSFFMNNVAFGTVATSNQSGFDWFGYEDPVSSLGGSPDLSGIFDNIQVLEGNALVPEPATGGLALLGGAGLFLRRRR